jgi:alpha-methylacyl-CoA racemase
MLPLTGVVVLDLSRLLPGPYASWLLASLGAEVLRVEGPTSPDYTRGLPPVVDGLSSFFRVLNRGKRSIVVDMKRPEGRDIVLDLVERSDVLLEQFRPGVLDRLGLTEAALQARRPDLITCSITGYGQTGPRAQEAGHDLNYEALSGLLWMSGLAGGRPPNPGIPHADLAGSMHAVMAILAALLHRERTGEGSRLDISMTESIGALASPFLAGWSIGREQAAGRGDDMLTGAMAQYRTYACADGEYLAVGALEPKFFALFAAAVGHPEWAAVPPFPGPHQAPLMAEIEAVLATQPRDHWARLLEGVDCCVTPVLHPQEAMQQAVFSDRGRLGEAGTSRWVETPVGPVTGGTAPHAGEHTREVLEGLGLDAARIDALLEQRIVETS